MMCSMSDTLHKILIIRFSSVGDIVLSSLLVRTVRNRFPDCQLDYCVKEEFADLVRWNPNVSRIIEFPAHGGLRDLSRLRENITRERYDIILDIHDSLRSRYLCFGTSRVVRIRKRKFARFLLVQFKLKMYHKFGGAPSVALRYIEPVKKFGVEDDGKGLEFFFRENARDIVREMVRGSGFGTQEDFIGICPSAKHTTKMWLTERFAETAAALSRDYNRAIAIFGSGNETQHCTEIAGRINILNPQSGILNLAGKLTLPETAAMMDRCFIVITNDSGLMHIAAARKRKVVAIFGPTVRELGFFPFGTESVVVENEGLDCRPCTHIGLPDCPKGHFKCMNDITAAQVIASATGLLHTRAQ